MIEIKNLTKNFESKKVIENFSLSVMPSSRVAIVSFSGSGKTTLLRLISGLDKKYQGSINVRGDISYMFQEDRLFPESTVFENVLAVSETREKAESLLRAVELTEFINMYPDGLSGGMKRRTALARALSYSFDVLLLDEPFSGLDEDTKKRVAQNVLPYIEKKTVVLVTHSVEEAKLLGCEVLYFSEGFIQKSAVHH